MVAYVEGTAAALRRGIITAMAARRIKCCWCVFMSFQW